MNQKSKCTLTAILVLALAGFANGQSKPDGYSISPKFGAFLTTSQTDPMTGFMVGAEGNIMNNQFLYSVNYYYNDEWIIVGSGPDRYFHQAGVLFGRYNTFGFFRLEYQAGVTALWGIDHTTYHGEGFLTGYYDTENFSAMGLTMEVGGEFILSKFYSMGTHLQFNLNNRMPNLGLVLSFSFGKHKR
ncbi:MAG: hypothetical protein PVF73_00210 [Bacteroidales bacterium]|jgi:hypothetical protein